MHSLFKEKCPFEDSMELEFPEVTVFGNEPNLEE